MIPSSELRIGNLVSFVEDANRYKDYHEVTDINTQIALCHNGDVDTGELFPIPLTPDILEKCGFVKNKLGEMSIEVTDPSFHLELMEGKENYFYPSITQTPDMDEERTVWLNRINSLHQLQNLFYCLVGEELSINL